MLVELVRKVEKGARKGLKNLGKIQERTCEIKYKNSAREILEITVRNSSLCHSVPIRQHLKPSRISGQRPASQQGAVMEFPPQWTILPEAEFETAASWINKEHAKELLGQVRLSGRILDSHHQRRGRPQRHASRRHVQELDLPHPVLVQGHPQYN